MARAIASARVCVAHCHVVECTVRLDVVRLHVQCGGDRLKNSELISHSIEHFLVAYLQFLASEIFAIEKTRMRSDSDSVLLRRGNCSMHRIGIASVKSGRDIRRADELEQFIIVACAFAEIGVQIDR